MTIEGTELTPSHIGCAVVSVGCPCGIVHRGVIEKWDDHTAVVWLQSSGYTVRCQPIYLRWLTLQPADERDGTA